MTEFVTEQLRDRIVLGQLKPGEKLSVYELAEELGVSRVPLREAVRQLEAESLVDNLARRGTIVRPLSVRDVCDAFQILDTIEVIAARRTAASGDSARISEMRHWLGTMQALSEKRTTQVSAEMLRAHREFHFAFFRGAGEGVLQKHLCMLWNTCERYVINSLPSLERRMAAAREHAELVRCIENQDPDKTVDALRNHLKAALDGALVYLKSSGVTTDLSPSYRNHSAELGDFK